MGRCTGTYTFQSLNGQSAIDHVLLTSTWSIALWPLRLWKVYVPVHLSEMFRWCISSWSVHFSIILPLASVVIEGSSLVSLPFRSPKHNSEVSESTSISLSPC